MSLKRILKAGVALFMATLMSTQAFAASASISVGLRDNRPIDIILAAGETDYDLDKFESTIRNALAAADVDLNRVKIQSVQSTNSAAETSFPWTVYASPAEFTGHASRQSTSSGDKLTFKGHEKTPFQVGYQYTVPSKGLTKFAVEFKVVPQRMDSHTISHGGFSFAGYDVRVYPKGNVQVSHAGERTVSLGTATSSGLVIRCEVTKSEAKFIVDGKVVHTSLTPPKEVGTLKAYAVFTSHNCPSISVFSVENVKVETQVAKDLIEVVRAPDWRPNSHRFVVDINDELRKDFQEGDKLGELIQRMIKDDAYYIGLGTSKNMEQMKSYIAKDPGHGYVADNSVGTVMTGVANFIAPIVNKRVSTTGRQYLLQSNEFVVTNSASLDNGTSTLYPQGKWLTEYSKTYREGTTDLEFINIKESPFWTDRRQREFSFSTNQVGYFTNYFEESKVSPFEIIVHQKPIPAVASIYQSTGTNITVRANTKSYDPDFYDPSNPGLGRTDRGIKTQEVKWRYAGLNNTAWNKSGVNVQANYFTISGLRPNQEYEIYYNVTDYQGSTGNAVIKYVNTKSQRTIRPIADFSLSTTKISIHNWNKLVDAGKQNNFQTVIQDLSYDPIATDANSLISYVWTWYSSDSDVAIKTFPASGQSTLANVNPGLFAEFLKHPATLGKGTYYLGLRVARSGSAETDTSELYKRVIEITREPYALWFSDMYRNSSQIDIYDTLPTPAKMMKGYNLNNVTFQNRSRVITFNALKGNPFTQVKTSYTVTDRGQREVRTNRVLKEYPLSLNTEYLWPVTSTQLANGETMFSVWGTPWNDWAFVPNGTDFSAGIPAYINGTSPDFVKVAQPWGYDFKDYLLISTTEEESFRLDAKIPDNWTTPAKIVSPELKRTVFDWIANKNINYSGEYPFQNGRFTISVPSTISQIRLQGTADVKTKVPGTSVPHRIAGVYFKELPGNQTTVNSKKEAFSATETSGYYTVNLPTKGASYNRYFYVMPETSKITEESYVSKNISNTTYAGAVFPTGWYQVAIRRMNDNVNLRIDDQELTTSSRDYKYLDNRTSVSYRLATSDINAIVLGYRYNGAENWNWIQSNKATITVPITRQHTTIDIMVQAEDREIQQIYTLNVNVPNTYDALGATVKYHSLTTNQTYNSVFDSASSTYTITLPENVRAGKLEVTTTNENSIVEKINRVSYDTNSVTLDYELPYHTNPSANFTIRSQENGRKSYVVKFVKQNDPPDITLLNASALTGVFSPQGHYNTSTGVYTQYAMLGTAGPNFSGNGIPIEVKIKNKEHVQGVRATVKFNNFDFEVHWGSYDGATYTDGKTELLGYAVISKEALAGLNVMTTVSCTVYDYDYANSSAVSQNTVDLATITCDSAGPICSHSASSTGGPRLSFTGVQDIGSKVMKFYMEYGPEESSGYTQATSFDVNGTPAFTVPLTGVTGPQRFRVTLTDILENKTTLDFNYDFSDVDGIDAFLEFGRNSDGFYIGTRKSDDQKIGLEQFEFVE